MLKKPRIISKRQVAKTQIFCIESLELEFSNGAMRTYERMIAGGCGAVMIVPINAKNELLLIREYSAGTDDYQLAFPKGLIDKEETPLQAANRELKEEVGFGANQLTELKSMTLAPGYLSHKMNLVLATELYPEKLSGDEPEPLQVVAWSLDDIEGLLTQIDFTEARSIAALLMVERYLNQSL